MIITGLNLLVYYGVIEFEILSSTISTVFRQPLTWGGDFARGSETSSQEAREYDCAVHIHTGA